MFTRVENGCTVSQKIKILVYLLVIYYFKIQYVIFFKIWDYYDNRINLLNLI